MPLDRTKIKRIAVLGANADPAVTGRYGSAYVTPFHATSVLEGIKQAAPRCGRRGENGTKRSEDRKDGYDKG